MAFLNWSSSYSVGVAVLDAEHRHFFDLLNQLYDSIMDGSASDAKAHTIIDQVFDFAVEHCSREEQMLEAAHFPHIAEIRQHHEYLRRTIQELRTRLIERGGISMELANFLMEWVLEHVLKEDKKCGVFLNAAGVY